MSNNLVLKTSFDDKISIYKTKANIGDMVVGTCKICLNQDMKKWSISSWYTSTSYQHQGYGTLILKQTLLKMYNDCGKPEIIEYIWNGANQYVMDWLEKNFDPVCKLPLAVQKQDQVDDWEAHMYVLNTEKVLAYFGIPTANVS